ncbi:MAG: prepilin-type N-terminal cleavage/methylation domain-containing protein [Candidatus Eremiobacteraeota bacterium]|nr:prepilin-type N-terminal cleavage/methylation domain-containing protein [Candidatus Eremiobacteraeota bacterium]
MVRRRGTTLIELMVVMAIWSAVMSAVLGFYIYGTKVSKRQDVLSQQLRQVQMLYDRIVGRITNAVIRDVRQGNFPALVYVRTRTEDALLVNGLLPNWTPQDEILAIVPQDSAFSGPLCFKNQLVLHENGQTSVLMKLPVGMLVSFEADPTDVLLQVKVPELSSQAPDLKTVDVASMYDDKRWRKITRAFLLNGWKGHSTS